MFKAPKSILRHPGVDECLCAKAQGFSSEFRYDVFLKDGWRFTANGKEDCQGGRFRTVADFFDAEPTRI